jgi:thymidylate synthase (FAD)
VNFNSDNPAANTFIEALVDAEEYYFKLLSKGWKPQQARQILPINTKSQVVHTAYYDEWIHFVKLRYEGVSGEPHPNIKVLAEQVYNLIIK